MIPPKTAHQFTYEAVQSKGRRQAPRARTNPEWVQLPKSSRRRMVATARDANRNMALLAWCIRKHLDYVSSFAPHVKTGDDRLDAEIESLLRWHADKRRFDAGQRHSREEAMRIFETLKVLDGDAFFLKTDIGALQGIEGDRITLPTDLPEEYRGLVDCEGLVLNEYGAAEAYCITKRYADNEQRTASQTTTGCYYDQIAPADSVITSGYYSRWDQARGVSPLSTALNAYQDLHEANEWTLLKIKLHALFGVAITRQSADPDGFPTTQYDTNDTDKDGAETSDPEYTFDLSRGVQLFDMDPGDDINTIESKTPSAEYISFTETLTRLVLLALDLPYTFFDSRSSSFSARIADSNEYELSAEAKRQQNATVLQQYSDWKIAQWAQNPDMLGRAIERSGLSLGRVQRSVSWIPKGMPWLDKLKQVKGDELAVAMGTDSIPRICKRRHNADWRDILRENEMVYRAYEEANVPLYIGSVSQNDVNSEDEESSDA